MKVGSLFSGIGGLDLGLEQAGMKTVWQVEYDDWARQRLEENFPHTEKFKDVREVGKHNLSPVDLICGGFPCQDVSTLNDERGGLEGKQSGLWFEYARIICELRPPYVLIENVTALVNAGLDRVLCDLAASGYDAEWQIIPAAALQLPHRRERLFIVAYTTSERLFSFSVFPRNHLQDLFSNRRQAVWNGTTVCLNDLRYRYPEIPSDLCVDDGVSYDVSDVKSAVKGYGNAVCPPVAKWIGERILEFDKKKLETRATDGRFNVE